MHCVVHHFSSITTMSSGSKVHTDDAPTGGMNSVTTNPPCGACKFLRRKCTNGCIFAPYFGSDQGAARFAAVHKVFGASNVSKLLQHIPVNKRQDTVVTVSYEAQARLSDPVYGCVSTILALQQQVAGLQAELAMVQTQLMNSKIAAANSLQASQQQHQQQQLLMQPQQQMQMNNNSLCSVMLQPAYSNNSSSSNNMNQFGSFNATQPSFEPLRLSQNLLLAHQYLYSNVNISVSR